MDITVTPNPVPNGSNYHVDFCSQREKNQQIVVVDKASPFPHSYWAADASGCISYDMEMQAGLTPGDYSITMAPSAHPNHILATGTIIVQ